MRPKLMLEISNISDIEISSYKIYYSFTHDFCYELFEEEKLIYISYIRIYIYSRLSFVSRIILMHDIYIFRYILYFIQLHSKIVNLRVTVLRHIICTIPMIK